MNFRHPIFVTNAFLMIANKIHKYSDRFLNTLWCSDANDRDVFTFSTNLQYSSLTQLSFIVQLLSQFTRTLSIFKTTSIIIYIFLIRNCHDTICARTKYDSNIWQYRINTQTTYITLSILLHSDLAQISRVCTKTISKCVVFVNVARQRWRTLQPNRTKKKYIFILTKYWTFFKRLIKKPHTDSNVLPFSLIFRLISHALTRWVLFSTCAGENMCSLID